MTTPTVISYRRFGLLLIGFLALGLTLGACASSPDDEAAGEEEATGAEDVVIEGFSHPESVAKDPASDTYYVSNIGEEMAPSAKDGDGSISTVSAEGEIQDLRFLPQEGGADTLHAPKGMAIVDGTLYVTDIDRVVGFDLDTREQVFNLDFASTGTGFLNDLAALDDETLFVSATDIGTVFRVSTGDEPTFSPIAEDIDGVNGLRYEDGTLYIVSFDGDRGIWRLPLDEDGAAQGDPQMLRDGIGQLDGLAVLDDGRLLISDWQGDGEGGALRVYNPEGDTLSAVGLERTIEGPADFYYDAEGERVWVPALPESRVIVTPWSE